MSLAGMPSVLATSWRPASGVWLGRPQLELPVLEMRVAVLRLERRVGDKRVGIRGLDHFCRALERRVGVPVDAQRDHGLLCGEFLGLPRKALAALLRRWTFVPHHLQLLARRARVPPGIGDDRHPRKKAGQFGAALHHERIAHSGHVLDLVDIGAQDLAAKNRALLVNGKHHPGKFEVDAVDLLGRDDGRNVNAMVRLADDLVILRILQLDGLEFGGLQRGCLGRKRAVTQHAPARRMHHFARRGRAFGFRHVPGLRGCGHKHLPAGGAHLPQRIPIHRRGRAAARVLRPIFRLIQVGLLDLHVFPVHVQLVGNNHRQMRFHSLPDLRIFRRNRDRAVRVYAHKRRGHECRRGPWPRRPLRK